jgi:hypothetical protein
MNWKTLTREPPLHSSDLERLRNANTSPCISWNLQEHYGENTVNLVLTQLGERPITIGLLCRTSDRQIRNNACRELWEALGCAKKSQATE